MAAGLFLPPDQIVYDKGKISWKRKEQIASGITAGLAGLAVYELLNFCFGRCLAVPHLHGGVLILRDKVAVILLVIVGIAAGYLYLIFRRPAVGFSEN